MVTRKRKVLREMTGKRMHSGSRFIKRAIRKPEALSKQLNIPTRKNIPISLLNKIIKAEEGEIIKNPTKLGKKRIKVTRLLAKRVIFAKTLKSFSKRNK